MRSEGFSVAAIVCVLGGTSCTKDGARNSEESALAATSSPLTPNPDEEATETVAILRSNFQLACACGDFPWVTCANETKSYARVVACASAIRDKCIAAQVRLPPPNARSVCAQEVETATSSMVTTAAKRFTDLVAWLETNKKMLEGPLARKSLSDVCADIGCADRPETYDDKYKVASFETVMGVECTKSLFQCGTDRANVCWINKVTSRLGIACDRAENHTDDPLVVRATGTHLR